MNTALNELKGIMSKYVFMGDIGYNRNMLLEDVLSNKHVKDAFFKSTDYPNLIISVELTNGSILDFYPLTFPTEYISYDEENCDAK